MIKTEVYRKAIKFLVHSPTLEIANSKKLQKNAINGDLYRSWRISSNFYYEKNQIRHKFSSAGYPMRFLIV